MRPGSVIVDMAASALGGNCELSQGRRDGRDRERRDDRGPREPAGVDAARRRRQFYARNISSLLLNMVKDGALNLDFEEEVTKATVITHDGAGRQRAVTKLLNPGGAA